MARSEWHGIDYRYRCTLMKNLHLLQKDGVLCDLLLRCAGGQVIPVHANVMCASSQFFKEKVDHWEVGHSGEWPSVTGEA